MKIQIIVNKNLVIIEDTSVNIDCAKFKEQFIFCEVNEKAKWIEKEPFNGKEQPKHWIEIEDFIEIAKLKSNQPNSYSVWNEDTKSWIEDIELKKEYEKSLMPKTITLRQAKLYLFSIELLDDIENIVSQNRAYQIEWEYANEVYRQSPLITLVKEAISLTDVQIDDMFIAASKL